VLRADRIEVADPRVIGAILPLSGRAREIGQRALRGLMLAAGSPPDGPPRPDAPQLVFRDDAGDPERAARAVEELVSTHRAIAIIGPLEGESATAAAARAQQLGVPMIALSPALDLARSGPMAFRLFPSTDGELRDLVRAARARGATRFAAIHPASPYGEAMRAGLARAVAAEGLQIATSASYPVNATSFGAQVEAIAGSGADAVLVADSARQLALIAPALAAGGLSSGGATPSHGRRITLLVPSVGFESRLAHTSGRYLEGAIFSVPFHAPTSQGEGRIFTDAFMARFATEPDAFAAYAYDAFGLVRRAVLAGATTREQVARSLAEGREAPTAGASQGISSTRDARRATRLFELRGQLFVPLAP
jgi:branched-chain amino acid transport system substrate-binding protein